MTDQPALHHIRILDFTWVLAGPYATRILADFGAEIIKIQPLSSSKPEDGFTRGYYNTWNRNKRGITLNLSKPEGVALARRLVSISDAVVENFAPRVMANWGLDYDNLKKVKPDILMLSLSAMGHSGPRRDYVGFGPTVQAFSGITALTSYPGKPPVGLGYAYADHIAGLVATLALLGALEYRRRTGAGQYIDVSQSEAMTSLLGEAFQEYAVTGQPPAPRGNRSSEAAPYGIYRCQGDDRWCAIAVNSDDEWRRFKQALGSPAWAEEDKFSRLAGRWQHADELDRQVEDWTRKHPSEEVMARLQAAGVAAGVVQSASDLANDPQLRARGFFIEIEKTVADAPPIELTVADAAPIKLSETRAEYRWAAPTLGQDNDYVYGQLLGMSAKEIAGLKRLGII